MVEGNIRIVAVVAVEVDRRQKYNNPLLSA